MIDFQTILDTSFKLYSRYGIKSIGVDDIAKDLGISKKTLYLNIESREDLIKRLVQVKSDQFFFDIKQVTQGKAHILNRLSSFYALIIKSGNNVCPAFTYDLKKYYWEQFKILENLYFVKLFDLYSAMIDHAVREGIFIENLSREIVYQCQIQKVIIHGNSIPIGNIDETTNEVIFKLILNDFRGISSLKGHQLLDEMYEDLMQLIN